MSQSELRKRRSESKSKIVRLFLAWPLYFIGSRLESQVKVDLMGTLLTSKNAVECVGKTVCVGLPANVTEAQAVLKCSVGLGFFTVLIARFFLRYKQNTGKSTSSVQYHPLINKQRTNDRLSLLWTNPNRSHHRATYLRRTGKVGALPVT